MLITLGVVAVIVNDNVHTLAACILLGCLFFRVRRCHSGTLFLCRLAIVVAFVGGLVESVDWIKKFMYSLQCAAHAVAAWVDHSSALW